MPASLLMLCHMPRPTGHSNLSPGLACLPCCHTTDSNIPRPACRSEFVFVNPNAKGSCGCGESFTTK